MANRKSKGLYTLLVVVMTLCACTPQGVVIQPLPGGIQPTAILPTDTPVPAVTPFPTRPVYEPGVLVDYTAQTGDTLANLAAHFNTTPEEIRAANPIIPDGSSTMPPGMPMKIPIYYMPFWGNPYKIVPDSQFVNGPAAIGFDVDAFVAAQPGWLKTVRMNAGGKLRTGAGLIEYVALTYSVSPRLLLALLEYQAGALTQPAIPAGKVDYPLGYEDTYEQGVSRQLMWAANTLNNGYYLWRQGQLGSLDLSNGRDIRPDPWQNAATVALHYYFSQILPVDAYEYAVSAEGFAATYQSLFGDPWVNDQPHIPGSLYQPEFVLPFEIGKVWAYTGGPHTGWGEGAPLAAIDFAPPSNEDGCFETDEWATAVAPGVIARLEPAIVVLDLDGDGDERTGWTVFYLHIKAMGWIDPGEVVEQGQPLGHPSCEGGIATGTHIHIARKYNGEWISAAGALAFNLEGWVAVDGRAEYQGTLTRFQDIITASSKSATGSHIQSGRLP